jgi:hypothetical protein
LKEIVASKFISERNLKFLLYEVIDVESLTRYEYYREHNRKTFDMVLKAALKLAKDLLFPIFEEMDRNQPQLVGGEVKVHPSVKKIMKEFTDKGFYLIKGQKIFISAGDHDGVGNVVHLMLAKIVGASPGVKGISLFVVPKKTSTICSWKF